MNYFAHGCRFLDRPYFLAGTAVPDWLSVSDRATRMRTRRVTPFADGSGSPQAEVAAGVLQHLHDDAWFHRTPAFHETTGELTAAFRGILPEAEGFRCSFLGHIVMELLLDAVLIERDPARLAEYYRVLDLVDPTVVQDAVNAMARDPAVRLAELIPLFLRERFLGDYCDPARLLVRLNQVMKRIKLPTLPREALDVLTAGHALVARRAGDLLAEPTPSTEEAAP